MHEQKYDFTFDAFQYKKRLKHAALNQVGTMVLTGTGEILQNTRFLESFAEVLEELDHPFPNVAVQTTGVMLMKTETVVDEVSGEEVTTYPNIQLLKRLGVNTISLSASDIFDDESNWFMNGTPVKLRVPLATLAAFIKKQGWNLRLSLNLTDKYDNRSAEEILYRCKELGANQITFRKLWQDGSKSGPATWVRNHAMDEEKFAELEQHIRENGAPNYRLPFGFMLYSLNGMSVAVDDDCMSKNNEVDDTLKYVILRENGKLYSKWDDEGSLIF